MVKEIRHTGSFKATNKDGIVYTINIFTEILDVGSFTEPGAEIEGLKQLQTDKGDAVNRVKKGEYEIVISGEALASDDPKAP